MSAGTIASTTIAIIDNDEEAGQVTLSLSPSTIAENEGSSTVTASLSSTSTAATTVTVSVDPASAVSLSSNTVLTMAAGDTTSAGIVTITAVDDTTYAGDRQVTVSGSASNAVGVTDPDDVALTITEDEVKPVTVSFGQSAYAVPEGASVAVRVVLSADPERTVTVPLSPGQPGRGHQHGLLRGAGQR